MFKSYDMKGFGIYIRGVRKSLKLTQKQVESLTGLSSETLRKIESGQVIPRYDTIEFLAKVYKTDLLSAFSEYRTSHELYTFYSYLDKIIIENKKEKIKELLKDFDLEIKEEAKLNLLNPHEISQLRYLIEGLQAFFALEDYQESMALCIKALQLSHQSFSIKTIHKHYYSKLEIRIIILISLCLSQSKEWVLANKLLQQCLVLQNYSKRLTKCEVCIIIKIHFNMSYNYFNLENDFLSLEHAEKGIEYCLEHDLIYMLANLLYRKGIAKYHLKIKDYKQPLQDAVNILYATGQGELAELFTSITLNKYNIILATNDDQ